MEYPDKGVWETFAYVNLKYRGDAPSGGTITSHQQTSGE